MFFSKSFGYALRGILYIAMMKDEKRYVQVEEISAALVVPRHFMGKIMKRMVKEEVLVSVKGPSGGFALHEGTLSLPLMRVMDITDGLDTFRNCALRVKACNAANPCPLHFQLEGLRNRLQHVLSDTTINDLLKEDKAVFLSSLSTAPELSMEILSREKIINRQV